ncbi:hypothetical protein C5167_033791 [Papaver somniferum]|uniref:Uncharacterized protein n=1 Tax=Papaver somniferum TaxID=3469 RepID=A0A4Y7KF47_PAPSO|nr:hypothetical protein C5167_033791 [Papaver somniferum]
MYLKCGRLIEPWLKSLIVGHRWKQVHLVASLLVQGMLIFGVRRPVVLLKMFKERWQS